MSRFKRILGSRLLLVAVLFAAQVAVLILGVYLVTKWILPLYIALYVLGIIVVIYVINSNVSPGYQISWLIIAAAFPLVTGIFYLMFGAKRVAPKFRQEHLQSVLKFKPLLMKEDDLNLLKKESDAAYKEARYLNDYSFYPIYKGSYARYFSVGEDMFEEIIAQLKKARHFIYIEMFIMAQGKLLDTVVSILEEKVREGVDVRVIYDDMGCAMYLPRDYAKTLQSKGIKCEVFNPMRPMLMVTMNNRDHRKLVIIDGRVAFTGGINFADEYINEVNIYGHWKDAGIMVEGPAVTNMVIMFLQFWQSEAEYSLRLPMNEDVVYENEGQQGYLQRFSDSPTDSEDIAKNAHLNMIWEAQKSVWIMTPYLVVDNEILTALKQAAKNGVDVRIIVPHVPDKWYVLETTRASYRELITAGCQVYEYTPGFIHSKVIIADGKMAIVGTINMDYRSYYLDFECGVFVYNNPVVKDIVRDFEDTFAVSQLIDIADVKKISIFRRILRACLKLFAPLM